MGTSSDSSTGCTSKADGGCTTSRQTKHGMGEDERGPPEDPGDYNITPNWNELDAIDDLMALHADAFRIPGVYTTVGTTVEPLAAKVVARPLFDTDCTKMPSTGSRNGTKYRAGSRNMVANQRENNVRRITEGEAPES